MSDIEVFYGEYTPDMKLADIHVHTVHSDGWWEPVRLAEAAVTRGLSAIAITDHDEIAGGFAVAEAVAKRGLPLQVIIGQEVSAREDDHDVHVLGLDLQEEVRPWQSIRATVEAILAQGGFPILPHPNASGFGRPTFDQILAIDMPVAVEIYNAGIEDLALVARIKQRPNGNLAARAFYDLNRERLAGAVGGTDAHFRTVGRGLTGYHGDLREAIQAGRTSVLIRRERERLMPWDPIGYWQGLKRLDARRSTKYGTRPR